MKSSDSSTFVIFQIFPNTSFMLLKVMLGQFDIVSFDSL